MRKSELLALAALGFGWLIAQNIIQPTSQLIVRMRNDTEGAADLTQRVDIRGTDEIASLGQLINSMISKLHDLIGRIRI